MFPVSTIQNFALENLFTDNSQKKHSTRIEEIRHKINAASTVEDGLELIKLLNVELVKIQIKSQKYISKLHLHIHQINEVMKNFFCDPFLLSSHIPIILFQIEAFNQEKCQAEVELAQAIAVQHDEKIKQASFTIQKLESCIAYHKTYLKWIENYDNMRSSKEVYEMNCLQLTQEMQHAKRLMDQLNQLEQQMS